MLDLTVLSVWHVTSICPWTLCNQSRRDQSDWSGGSCQSHLQTTHGSLWTCSPATRGGTSDQDQVDWLYGWQSTRGQGVDLTAIHAGSVAPDDQGTPGFVNWRLILESLLTRHGTLPSTAANGGRYDPSWSREADDDDDDDGRIAFIVVWVGGLQGHVTNKESRSSQSKWTHF